MFLAFGHLLLDEKFGPEAMQNGLAGVLEEALMELTRDSVRPDQAAAKIHDVNQAIQTA